MAHPKAHDLWIADQAHITQPDGTIAACGFVEIKCEEMHTWTNLTIYSSGEDDGMSKSQRYLHNAAFARRIIKALAMLEAHELCQQHLGTIPPTNTHEHN